MAEDKRMDDVEKLLADEQALGGRKQALISELLNQREAAAKDYDEKKAKCLKEFDEKLAKLNYRAAKPAKAKRSHHKKIEGSEKSKAKP